MAFNNIDEATSLLIAQLALQDIEEYNRDVGGVGETDEQIAFRLQEEDFELYLREQGLTRDRTGPGIGQGQPQHPQPTTAPSQLARPSSGASSIVSVAALYAAPDHSRLDQPQHPQPTIAPSRPSSRASSIVSVASLYAAPDHSRLGQPQARQAYQPQHPEPTTTPSQFARPSSRASSIVSVASLYAVSVHSRPGPSSVSMPLPQRERDLSSSSSSDLCYTSFPFTPNLPECIVCSELIIPSLAFFEAPCGHFYCESCLEDYINTSIQDECCFPPQCCRKAFPLGPDPAEPSSTRTSTSSTTSSVSLALTNWRLVRRLHEKSREFSVEPKDRIYCPNTRCSVFVGSQSAYFNPAPLSFSLPRCHTCRTDICYRCKQMAHPGNDCPPSPEEMAEKQVRDLAQEKKWQTCPGCKQMVEKTEGCFHIICRCKAEFCYGCGATWRGGSVCICGEQPVGQEHAVEAVEEMPLRED